MKVNSTVNSRIAQRGDLRNQRNGRHLPLLSAQQARRLRGLRHSGDKASSYTAWLAGLGIVADRGPAVDEGHVTEFNCPVNPTFERCGGTWCCDNLTRPYGIGRSSLVSITWPGRLNPTGRPGNGSSRPGNCRGRYPPALADVRNRHLVCQDTLQLGTPWLTAIRKSPGRERDRSWRLPAWPRLMD